MSDTNAHPLLPPLPSHPVTVVDRCAAPGELRGDGGIWITQIACDQAPGHRGPHSWTCALISPAGYAVSQVLHW